MQEGTPGSGTRLGGDLTGHAMPGDSNKAVRTTGNLEFSDDSE